MNQRKVEIKLIRHLIQNAFNDQEKTINIDDCLEGKIIDVDILSLEHALQKIKTLNFEFNVINDLYYSILPGIEKKVYKKIFKTLFDDNLSPEEVYQQIIVKEIFHHLSFVMGALIYNILYYKKHKTFIVFFYKCAPELSSIMSNDINAKDFFEELKKVNATYHIKKFSPDIIELKQILLKVFNKNQDLLGLKRIGVFGSYGRGDYNEYSDIDILVETDPSVDLEIIYIFLIKIMKSVLGNHADLKINHQGVTPTGFLKNCYKNALWFN